MIKAKASMLSQAKSVSTEPHACSNAPESLGTVVPCSSLARVDCRIYELLLRQEQQEQTTPKLIASENFVSSAVLEATGSIFTNSMRRGTRVTATTMETTLSMNSRNLLLGG